MRKAGHRRRSQGWRHHRIVPAAKTAQHVRGKAQGGAVMRRDPTGRRRPCLDLVQGAGQQAALGQQGVDLGKAERHGAAAGALGRVGALQAAYLLATRPGSSGEAKSFGEMAGICPLNSVCLRVGDNRSLFVLITRTGRVNESPARLAQRLLSLTP